MILSETKLCLDCETLRDCRTRDCPVCASRASAFLAEWIPSARQIENGFWVPPARRVVERGAHGSM
jgi:hypothetical protein